MPANLAEWLAHLEALHPSTIDMGLERIAVVRDRLGLQPQFPIITVAGTNGKGSVCAFLATILHAAGYRAGLYTSPHLLRYNERVRVDLEQADDVALCDSFAAVEAARGDVSLTYFEFGTLAAIHHFMRSNVDVAILEVGLGGRLDAVNVFEPDCAVVVSVDLDHQDYLGPDRESIGREKAGIFRTGKPAIIGEPNPPASLLDYAQQLGADWQRIGGDFGFQRQELQWSFSGRHGKHLSLPFPGLRGSYQLANAAVALAALGELRERLPVGINAIKRGLLEVDWPGRFQVLPGRPTTILDVAHNPHAARALASGLKTMGYHPQTFAVFSLLRDKDIAGVIDAVKDQIDCWYVSGLGMPRGMSGDELAAKLAQANVCGKIVVLPSVAEAYFAACDKASENDRIVVFGSFHTVAAAMAARRQRDR